MWLKTVLWLLGFAILGYGQIASAYYAENFMEAKKMARMIWSEHRETFYCGCIYDKQGVIDYKHCSYVPADIRHSKRISWEHVLPVSWYGKRRACWKEAGRKGCQKSDPEFRKMEADLHNLVPAIREINQKRRNYHYAELPSHHQGACHFYIDEHRQAVEPRDEVKGMAARTTLYMAKKYKIPLEKNESQLLMKWNKHFPPSDWERRWHQQVSTLQGDVNPFIQQYKNKTEATA